jgi:uncharacterized membrane protein YkoI
MSSIRTKLTTVAMIVAAAVGGSAIANAATSNSASTTSSASSSAQSRPPAQRDPSQAGHRFNGRTEVLLTGATAAKVKAATLAKVAGTVERVETNVDNGTPYEAHIKKADGTEVIVLVDSNFDVSAVDTMGHR